MSQPTRGVGRYQPLCLGLVIGLTWSILVGQSDARATTSSTSQAQVQREARWHGARWTIRGRSIETRRQSVTIEGAVATPVDDPRWQLRAERLTAGVDWTGGMVTQMRARGDIRLIGPEPIYVVGRRAVSFRPAQSITIAGRPVTNTASGWRLQGREAVVDLAAGVVDIHSIGETDSEPHPSKGATR